MERFPRKKLIADASDVYWTVSEWLDHYRHQLDMSGNDATNLADRIAYQRIQVLAGVVTDLADIVGDLKRLP